MTTSNIAIPRHKTAIRRGDYSRPVKCALRDGLVSPEKVTVDYGCGRGEDVALLNREGIRCVGWDPVFRPEARPGPGDVVNLGYVINVIENPVERAETLRAAWALTREVLVVAAQVTFADRGKAPVPFADGVLTGRGTFQKFYEQDELKEYLESILETEAVAAGVGVFYVFRSESLRQGFLQGRFRRRIILPRRRITERLFDEHRPLLESLTTAMASLGRLPEADEFPETTAAVSAFGSLKRAFAVIQRVTGVQEWEAIGRRRREDLLVYLALSRFGRRPQLADLPLGLQRDVRAFLGNYKQASAEADALLFRAGKAEAIDEACRRSKIGKLLPDDLYIHRSAIDYLEPLLRVYEGCGRAYLGEIEGANLIKFHRRSGKLSYLIYPDFDRVAHPVLVRSVRLSLRTRRVDLFDYEGRASPPILHRKETFLHSEHPFWERFSRLTKQEERAGLLEDPQNIGTLDGWERRLHERNVAIRGHRLIRVRRPDASATAPGLGDECRPVKTPVRQTRR